MKENTVQRATSASLLSPAAPAGIHSLSLSDGRAKSKITAHSLSLSLYLT